MQIKKRQCRNTNTRQSACPSFSYTPDSLRFPKQTGILVPPLHILPRIRKISHTAQSCKVIQCRVSFTITIPLWPLCLPSSLYGPVRLGRCSGYFPPPVFHSLPPPMLPGARHHVCPSMYRHSEHWLV
ncbi:hypothetical protein SERLA73DRAFT_178337 [Serpula lacrymans var. lacrymans S7.3]|uniref:Uncharacterized protein n=2 Tax=Serpula lacrymans var. lacrymans TaxID=341189 RepID=F8PRB5_SERL3|nr:uncharacterized protein SERLADRAFT_462685 [Serpula lacrymans var. lacrymans S7.9]EGO02406.1 hypothetical protein SERLA73DRAFT_178337 [Serpula lacrymans var. lacrymans S7.3]EGO28132.1 hypothetical protein SERLADRAFT_462685 [Serpula lacrymans var. lacrymans S7.9]